MSFCWLPIRLPETPAGSASCSHTQTNDKVIAWTSLTKRTCSTASRIWDDHSVCSSLASASSSHHWLISHSSGHAHWLAPSCSPLLWLCCICCSAMTGIQRRHGTLRRGRMTLSLKKEDSLENLIRILIGLLL